MKTITKYTGIENPENRSPAQPSYIHLRYRNAEAMIPREGSFS
jgi:hypothetical protein